MCRIRVVIVTVRVKNILHVCRIKAESLHRLKNCLGILLVSGVDEDKSVARVDKVRGRLKRADKIYVSYHSEWGHSCHGFSPLRF